MTVWVMPELPEVETIRTQLNDLLVCQRIIGVDTRWAKSLTGMSIDPSAILRRSIEGISRRGKVIIVAFDGGLSALVHLRMTGQLLYQDAVRASSLEPMVTSSTRVIFDFENGARMLFNDQRKFGRILVVPTNEIDRVPLLSRLGPEPLEQGFTPERLGLQLAKRPRSGIKSALLDQSVLAGIGNIYADEVLWSAGLHPEKRCRDLDQSEIRCLARAIGRVLGLALSMGGSTARDYVDAYGRRGTYLEVAKVYGRVGDSCRRCGTTITKIRVSGRGTSICSSCQQNR